MTMISSEIIKPSLPTPSHLKLYNLSPVDQFLPSALTPLIIFYPKRDPNLSPHDQILTLKNSLSQTLTKYYPFAGRYARIAPTYVDCNDHGVEFIEALADSTLSDFLQNLQHEDLDQFFPCGRVRRSYSNPRAQDLQSDTVMPLAVQVNHFDCGGVAIAVSLSHKIADGSSIFQFLNDWGKVARACSKKEKHDFAIEPRFVSLQHTKSNLPELSLDVTDDCATRSFVFCNTKLNELKLKVEAMTIGSEQQITNATRVEVLTWLLYKCAVTAASKSNSHSFKPSSIGLSVNIRDKMMEPMPDNSIGNFVMSLEVQTMNEHELKPELLIGEWRKQKMGIQRIKNLEAYLNIFSNFIQQPVTKSVDAYVCTSQCGFPAYEIDFGWGTPVKVTFVGNLRKNTIVMMDAPNKEGIEVLVCLGKQEMDIIQRDPELLAFC